MSFLMNLEPKKETKTFEITAYHEDTELFLGAIEFLQSKNKGSGTFTQESLFEHLLSPLRTEKDLTEFISNKLRRKRRGTKSKAQRELVSEITQ